MPKMPKMPTPTTAPYGWTVTLEQSMVCSNKVKDCAHLWSGTGWSGTGWQLPLYPPKPTKKPTPKKENTCPNINIQRTIVAMVCGSRPTPEE